MLTAAVLSALMLQQAAPGPVVWTAPAEPAPAVTATAAAPAIPDWARADPFGYERSECSPLIRAASEPMEACQSRVRLALAANLGDALPAGLRPSGSPDNCRQEAAGDRYAMQCGAPSRSVPAGPDLSDRNCTTRPAVTNQGAVAFREECTVGGREVREEGLKINLGRRD
ncbi:hypothetical protein [Brevundimonas sp.]|jgi:hypothetical protein|uniref:hypothetical protein n=1 Tax=Brevundimonas sp. TaxID=1871086 RepID=UPI0025C305CB|nr:hypothetical protein [Brevundimonas sp.]